MSSVSCRVVTFLLLILMTSSIPSFAADKIVAEAKRPLLMAHYLPWFEAPPTSAIWGWHWSMNHFAPETIAEGKRSIASHYYPLIGPYDSSDPAILEYHLLLMKLAGIDGVIVDWYGRTAHFDYAELHRNSAALLEMAARFEMRFAVCYEDQTIPQLVAAQKITAEQRVQHATQELDWLQKNWFSHPAYLRYENKPVWLSFGTDGLNAEEWQQVLATEHAPWIYLSEHQKRAAAQGAFDWPIPQRGLESVTEFTTRSAPWPVAMPVAFPRFHDIYREAEVHQSWGRIADNDGKTFATTLRQALQSDAPFVQIATWNDWGEGTQIEPSVEFGYRDLEVVQHLRHQTNPEVTITPDALRLPQRLFLLRQYARTEENVARKIQLDGIAQLLARRELSAARNALQQAEVISLQ